MGSLCCSESEYSADGNYERRKIEERNYAEMEKWYAHFFETEKGKECITEFDRVLPDYKGISPIKKVDSILWSIR